MDRPLREKARQLAARNYGFRATLDETTSGQPIYLAEDVDLPNCLAQGATIREAVENLADARVEYILSLLEDDLAVPEPGHHATVTGHETGGFILQQTVDVAVPRYAARETSAGRAGSRPHLGAEILAPT